MDNFNFMGNFNQNKKEIQKVKIKKIKRFEMNANK